MYHAYFALPAQPPKLLHHQLRDAQTETLTTPPRRYGFVSRLFFLTVNLLYGRRGSLEKFKVLEQLAPVQYRAWEQVAFRALRRRRPNTTLARRIFERVVEARAQQANEQWHLLIVEELLQRRERSMGMIRFRLIPRLMAAPYHAFSWLLHLVKPEWSYRLNADFEDHAEREYMRYVSDHPELEAEAFRCVTTAEYGDFASVADVLRQIAHDERVHKLASMHAVDGDPAETTPRLRTAA